MGLSHGILVKAEEVLTPTAPIAPPIFWQRLRSTAARIALYVGPKCPKVTQMWVKVPQVWAKVAQSDPEGPKMELRWKSWTLPRAP